MAETTKIEWCDATFNPWVGCTKVSPACDHCYAESWAKRTGSPELWQAVEFCQQVMDAIEGDGDALGTECIAHTWYEAGL